MKIHATILTALMPILLMGIIPAGVTIPAQAEETEQNKSELKLLNTCRQTLCERVGKACGIPTEHLAKINVAPIRLDNNVRGIDVRMENEELLFSVQPQLLNSLVEQLRAEGGDHAETKASIQFVTLMAAAVSDADILLLNKGKEIKQDLPLLQTLGQGMAVSAINLLSGKEQTLQDYTTDSAVKEYIASATGKKILSFDQAGKVYVRNPQAVTAALSEANKEQKIADLLSDKQPEETPASNTAQKTDDPYADKYPGISRETRKFWYNLKPLDNSEDTTGFHNTVKAIGNHMYPNLHLVPRQEYRSIPFENITPEQAKKGNNWYSGASAQVQISRESVKFWHEVIVPKYGAFLKALSKEVAHFDLKGKIRVDRGRYSIAFNKPKGFKDEGMWIYFITLKNPEELMDKKKGEEVALRMVVYYLPNIFSQYYTSPCDFEKRVYANLYDEKGKVLVSSSDYVSGKAYWIEYTHRWDVRFGDVCLPKGKKAARTEFEFLSGNELERLRKNDQPDIDTDENAVEIEQPEENTDGEYAGVSQTVQDFWMNLELPESKQDLAWFGKFTEDINKITRPQYIISSAEEYKQIPFDQLSADEAKRSKYWFKGAHATLRISPEYLRFYREVILPKYREVLEFFAVQTSEETVSAKIYRGKLDYSVSEQQDFHNILADVENPDALLNAHEGDMVNIKIYHYSLPPAFKSYYNSGENQSIKCYAHAIDAEGKQIISTEALIYPADWYVLGRGRLICPTVSFEDFYIWEKQTGEATQEYAKTLFNMRDKFDTFNMQRPEPPTPMGESVENVFLTILGSIVILWLLSIPYMGWVLFRERRRRWVELELPEDYEIPSGCVFDVDGLRNEFNELRTIWNNMEVEEIEGVEVHYFAQKKEIDTGYKALQKFKGISDLSNDEKYALNAFGADLNNAQGRELGCEMKQFIIICAICGAAGLMMGFVAWAVPFVYYLALQTPRYKLDIPEPWYLRIMHRLLYGLGVGMFVASGRCARGDYDTVYIDKHGRAYKDAEEKTAGCVVVILMLMLALFLAPFLIMAQCLIHFIRNYISNR